MDKIIDLKFDFENILSYLEMTTPKYSFRKEIKLYRKIINNIEKRDIIKDLKHLDQIYDIDFKTNNDTFGFFYKIYWNVQTAKSIIIEKQIKPEKFDVEKSKLLLTETEIDENKAVLANFNDNPIIIGKDVDMRNFILDGNHRMYNAVNDKNKFINAYILSENDSMDCIATDNLKTIFKIHKNIIEISKKISGVNIEKLTFAEKFEKGKLFSLHTSFVSKLFSSFLLYFQI